MIRLWALITSIALPLSTACYSGPDRSPLTAPQGYTVFLRKALPGDVIVQLSLPTEVYEARPELYDSIDVNAKPLVDALLDGSEVANPLGVVLGFEPEGLVPELPVLLQVQWPPDQEQSGEQRTRFYKFSTSAQQWSLMAGDSLDVGQGVGSAWIDELGDTAPLSLFKSSYPNAVTMATPALAGKPMKFKIDGGDVSRYVVHCDGCDLKPDLVGNDIIAIASESGMKTLAIWYKPLIGLPLPVWIQHVYVAPPTDFEAWRPLAEAYRPTLKFSRDRLTTCKHTKVNPDDADVYYPSSLADILRKGVVVGVQSDEGTTVLDGVAARAYLASHASVERRIDVETAKSPEGLSGATPPSPPTVYWHVDPAVPVGDGETHVFITYWMFYPWDPKSPQLRKGAHVMDRESMTVEFDCLQDGPDGCQPVAAWYAGHLPMQAMCLLDPKDGQHVVARWRGDALRVPWHRVERASEASAVAYVAYGSHALFPRSGIYYVDPITLGDHTSPKLGEAPDKGFDGGTEAACGDRGALVPTVKGNAGYYELRPLDMSTLSSLSAQAEAALLFSGDWVEFEDPYPFQQALLSEHLKFPPFIERYFAIGDWAVTIRNKNDDPDWCQDAECLDVLDPPTNPPDQPPPEPETCPDGDRTYCGESVGLTAGTLYDCQDGVFTEVQACPNGCTPGGAGDFCADPPCPCPAGPCCDSCDFRPSSYVCLQNADSENGCPWGTAPGDDVGVRYRHRRCSGADSECTGTLTPWGPWVVGDSCTSDELCVDGDSTCNAQGCAAATYWSPSSVQDLDNDGTQYWNGQLVPLETTGIRIEINESATPGNLRLRVCKVDNPQTNLNNAVHVYFKNNADVVMFNQTLANNGTPCSEYGEMSNEGSYSEGNVLDGSWRVVSPSTSASEWTTSCTKAQANDASGTCWWDVGLPPIVRTCK